MPAATLEIFKAADFKALPVDRLASILGNYFDREMADDEFNILPDERKSAIRNNFVQSQLGGQLAVQPINGTQPTSGTQIRSRAAVMAADPTILEDEINRRFEEQQKPRPAPEIPQMQQEQIIPPQQQGAFNSLIQGLAAGVFDVAATPFTITRAITEQFGEQGAVEIGAKRMENYLKQKAAEHPMAAELQGKNLWDNPEIILDPRYTLYGVGNMAPSFLAAMIPGTAALRFGKLAAATVGGVSAGMMEGANTYRESIERGNDPDEAFKDMMLMTVGSGALNAIGFDKIFKANKGKKLIQATAAALTEGLTEYAEEPLEATILRMEPEEFRQKMKDGLAVIGPAMIMGGGGAAAANYIQGAQEARVKALEKEKKEGNLSLEQEERLVKERQALREMRKELPTDEKKQAEIDKKLSQVLGEFEEKPEQAESEEDLLKQAQDELDKYGKIDPETIRQLDEAAAALEKPARVGEEEPELKATEKPVKTRTEEKAYAEQQEAEKAQPEQPGKAEQAKAEIVEGEKAPWQMRKDEFFRKYAQRTELLQEMIEKAKKRLERIGGRGGSEEGRRIGDEIDDMELELTIIRPFQKHTYTIKQALAEGKDVPEEVLADYPELSRSLADEEMPVGENDPLADLDKKVLKYISRKTEYEKTEKTVSALAGEQKRKAQEVAEPSEEEKKLTAAMEKEEQEKETTKRLSETEPIVELDAEVISHVNARVRDLGSVEAVAERYDTDSAVDRYARQQAEREFGEKKATVKYREALPNNVYVHGRQGRQDLKTGHIIMGSKSWDIAEYYAGKKGSIWTVSPKPGANLFDVTNQNQLDAAKAKLQKAYDNGELQPSLDEIIAENGIDAVVKDMQPERLADNAGALDEGTGVIEWLDEQGYDGIKTEDGIIALNRDQFDFNKTKPETKPPAETVTAEPASEAGEKQPWEISLENYVQLAKARESDINYLNAQIIKEADGYTRADAKVIGAETNIREGRGTVYDHAEYFRNIPEKEAAKGRDRGLEGKGYKLAVSASDDLYAAFQNRAITSEQALAIVEAAGKNAESQAVGMRVISRAREEGRKLDPDDVANLVRANTFARRNAQELKSAKQGDLFGGGYDEALELSENLSQIASRHQKDLKEKILALRIVKKSNRLNELKKVGLEFKSLDEAIEALKGYEREYERWQHWDTDKELRQQILDELNSTTGQQQGLKFSTVEATPSGRTVRFVERVIAPFREQFVTPINVVQSVNDLPARYQEKVRAEMEKGGVIRGFFDPATEGVWLVADSMGSKRDVLETALHEPVTHYGLRKVLGPEIDNFYRKELIGHKDWGQAIQGIADRWGISQEEAAEEWIAGQIEQGIVEPTLMDRLIAAIRRALKALGLDLKYSRAELTVLIDKAFKAATGRVQQRTTETGIGEPALAYRRNLDKGLIRDELERMTKMLEELPEVRNGRPTTGLQVRYAQKIAELEEQLRAAELGLKYSRKTITDLPEFKRWFGDSKVVDKNGEPLVVYHGTKGDFNTFEGSQEDGYHFGTSAQASMRVSGVQAGRNVMPVYLKAERIKRIKDSGVSWKKSIKNAKRNGYDGIVYLNRFEGTSFENVQRAYDEKVDLNKLSDKEFLKRFPEATDSYIVFSSTQIKSATGNVGTFDPNNPDIRFSRVEQTKDRLERTIDQLNKNLPEKGKDKIVRHRMSTLIKQKIRNLKTGARLGRLDMAAELYETKQLILEYARQNLPQTGITRGQVKPLLTQIARAKTADDVAAAFKRVDSISRTNTEKALKNRIATLLNRFKPQKKQGRIKGTSLTASEYTMLDNIREIAGWSQARVDNELADL